MSRILKLAGPGSGWSHASGWATNKSSFGWAAPILRTLIEQIVLHPGDKRGTMSIEVYGEPSAPFLLANEEPSAVDNRMIRVVAEEGLEPPTRGL
jgi:hypothetical protein